MSVKVFITIDTEEDSWGNFKSTNHRVENVKYLAALQELFDRYGAIPTYLVNYPVVNSPSAVKIIKNFFINNRCDIGTHIHPWNTPPYTENRNDYNSMLCNLPTQLIYDKLLNLHQQITKSFNIEPICFRAGRWAFNSSVAECLSKIGYRVDTSVTPFVNWQKDSGPDFRTAPSFHYLFNPENVTTPDNKGRLLEVPASVNFIQRYRKFCFYLREKIRNKSLLSHLRLIGILHRLRLLNFYWLSPELSNGNEMVRLAKALVQSGHKFLNMSFHSTSLFPGQSPFVKDRLDLKNFLNNIETFLKFAIEKNMTFLPLSKSHLLLKSNRA